MSSIPSAKGIDSTLALLRNPYEFIPDTCRDLEGDLFETRILFQKTICMTGAAAAEVFYSEDGLVRAGAIALGLKAIFLVTTVLGITGLWIAILADTGATLLVTMNALRLLFFRPTGTPEPAGHVDLTAETRPDRAAAKT